jgi:hypothetical protein
MLSGDDMSKRPAKPTADAAPALNIPERLLLFCVASGTDWEHAGITGAPVTAMMVRGMIERDATPSGHRQFSAVGLITDDRRPVVRIDARKRRHVAGAVPHGTGELADRLLALRDRVEIAQFGGP